MAVISSIGTGGDYTDLTDWESFLPESGTEEQIAEIKNETITEPGAFTFDAGGTYKVTIRPEGTPTRDMSSKDGAGPKIVVDASGNYDDAFRFFLSSNHALELFGVKFIRDRTGNNQWCMIINNVPSGSDKVTVDSVLLHNRKGGIFGCTAPSSDGALLCRTLLYAEDSRGNQTRGVSTSHGYLTVDDCTCVSGYTSLERSGYYHQGSGTTTLTNSVAYNWNVDCEGCTAGAGGAGYNATGDATAPGTTVEQNISDPFVDSTGAAYDLNPTSGSALDGNGQPVNATDAEGNTNTDTIGALALEGEPPTGVPSPRQILANVGGMG